MARRRRCRGLGAFNKKLIVGGIDVVDAIGVARDFLRSWLHRLAFVHPVHVPDQVRRGTPDLAKESAVQNLRIRLVLLVLVRRGDEVHALAEANREVPAPVLGYSLVGRPAI